MGRSRCPAGPLLAQCAGANVVSSTSTCDRFAVDGSFKVPGLRNVELTGPYFHNGGQATLEEVVEFYNRGGDFAHANQDDVDPNIKPLGLTTDDRAALVAFLKTLTDERVRSEQKPFDHPQLCLPNPPGGVPGTTQCTKAVGEAGLDPILPFLGQESLFSQAFDPIVLAGQIGSSLGFNGLPDVGQTPELDSLALFGSGLMGLAGYAMTRRRASRRRRNDT